MAKFQYKVHHNADEETIEAKGYHLDTQKRCLTFYDDSNDQIASFATDEGAWVKRTSK